MNRNPTAALELAVQFPNQIIRASAGTGKTFQLSNRYLRLLASGADSESILATTFTRKGAGEILDRIMNRLSEAALDQNAAMQLSEELSWKLTSARAAEVLHKLLRNLHRLEIGTLDSFFNRFGRAFSLELGLPAVWEIVPQQQIDQLQDRAIQSILYSKTVVDLFHLMVQGDANRKIATEVRSVVSNLYETFCECKPDAWDQIPRTGKLLKEAQRVELVQAMTTSEIPSHKTWEKQWAGLIESVRDESWNNVFANGIVKKVADGEPKYCTKPIPDAVRAIISKLVRHCEATFTQNLILQNNATRDLLQAFSDQYERLKSDTGLLRFQDVTQRLERFVESFNTEGMAFRLDNQLQHLLLDEFQDTSPAQWNVLRPFAKRVTDNNDGLNSFFCVGDVKQAVFGWRGGVAEIFDRVNDELSNLSDTLPMTKSFRSSPHVIDFVNTVFQNLDRYQPKDSLVAETVHSWSGWFHAHSTAKDKLDGCVTVEVAGEIADEEGKVDAAESLTAAAIDRIVQLNSELADGQTIGVLVRTNAEVGELIFRLQQLGIPTSEEGGNPLTDAASVEIVLAALKLADSPGDSIARFRLSHSPLGKHFGLPLETVENQPEVAAAAHQVAQAIRRQLVADGYGRTLESMARVLANDCTQREATRLQQLVQVAYSTDAGRDLWQLRPGRFVNFIRDEYRAVEPSAARIRVMTIHKSKGLEFDAVVLPMSARAFSAFQPAVVTGRENPAAPIDIVTRYANKEIQAILPDRVQRLFLDYKRQEIREAMCVLYVAITRAVHATHVLLAPNVKSGNATMASVLMAAVQPDDAENPNILYSAGNASWHLTKTKQQETALTSDPASLDSFYLPDDAALQPSQLLVDEKLYGSQPARSPSQLAGRKRTTLNTRLSAWNNPRAVKRGAMLHACFEAVGWLDEDALPDDNELLQRLQRVDSNPQIIGEVLTAFHQSIERDEIRNLVRKSEYLRIPDLASAIPKHDRIILRRENRFAIQTDTGLLSGSIDRLILFYHGDELVLAHIIDFKTGDPDETSDQQLWSQHADQIEAYRKAVTSTFGLSAEKIVATLAFTATGRIVSDPESSTVAKQTGQQQTLW